MTFDLDALVAEASDDTPEPFEFTVAGERFQFAGELDRRAVIALAGGDSATFWRVLFGTEQWSAFTSLDFRFTEEAELGLLRAYGKHLGTSLGESQASTVS